MNTRHDDLGQTLLDVGRHGFLLLRYPEGSERVETRPIPRLAEASELPPNLQERLAKHRRAILRLLTDGLSPSTPNGFALLDSRILAWDAAGLPADYLRPGGHAWAVIAGELLGGRWPES